ncbi:MAG: hypothetical protein ACLQOO_19685 [Terriglobia bacterium]
MLEVQKSRLLPSTIGEIDVLAGRLEWNDLSEFERTLAAVKEEVKGKGHPSNTWFLAALRLANAGGLRWPPPTDWLVAIEAKCAYLSPQADSISREHVKSTKASAQNVAHLRRQVYGLLEMGFNRVALLDVIASPPASGQSGGAWVTAAGIADETRRAMLHDLDKRLPAASPAGHCVYSIGAVAGGDEASRAAVSADWRRPALDNPLLVSDPVVRGHRKLVEENLVKIFDALPKPPNLRAVYCDCLDCRQVHPEGKPCSG